MGKCFPQRKACENNMFLWVCALTLFSKRAPTVVNHVFRRLTQFAGSSGDNRGNGDDDGGGGGDSDGDGDDNDDDDDGGDDDDDDDAAAASSCTSEE